MNQELLRNFPCDFTLFKLNVTSVANLIIKAIFKNFRSRVADSLLQFLLILVGLNPHTRFDLEQ